MSVAVQLPNFFIVGAPKAGTTSLYAYLDQHPEVYMSPLKEPNYFASELRPENLGEEERSRVARESAALERYLQGDMREKRFGGLICEWDDYTKLFRNVSGEIAIGEASACYLWSPTAARNIAARIPNAKILINLRNPVDRAYSQYLQMITLGLIRTPFGQHIADSMRASHRQFSPVWPFLEFGLYHEQVLRYMNVFPRSRIHISYYEELDTAAPRLLSELFAFLGVDPDFRVDSSLRHHQPQIPRLARAAFYLKKSGLWPRVRALLPSSWVPMAKSLVMRPRASLEMQQSDRLLLTDYYRDDIAKLEKLLDRDLKGWLRPAAG